MTRVSKFKWLAGLLVALPAAAALFYGIEDWRGKTAWEQYRADCLRLGVQLDAAAFLPPPPAPEDNYAALPLFSEAFKIASAGGVPKWPLELPTLAAGRPALAVFAKQMPVDLEKWREFFLQTGLLPAKGQSAAADVLVALEGFAPALESLAQMGNRPGSRFPVSPWAEKELAAPVSCAHVVQKAMTLRALRLGARLARREGVAALGEWREILRLEEALGTEPSLIAGLVRASTVAQLCGGVWTGLRDRVWEPAQLLEIEARLASIHLLEDYAFSIKSERALANLSMRRFTEESFSHRIARLNKEPADMNLFGEHEQAIRWRQKIYPYVMPRGWFFQNQLAYNRSMDAIVARVDGAASRLDLGGPMPASPEWLHQRSPWRFCFLAATSPGTFEAVEKMFVAGACGVQLARIGCALERFALAHEGRYPETLEALVPGFLEALPREILSGQPLLYRLEAGGRFVLYSRAINQKDDGGKSEPAAPLAGQPDWLWTYPPAPSAPGERP